MQITSETKIIPLVFTEGCKVVIKAFAPDMTAFVHLYESENYKKGTVSGPVDRNRITNFVAINCLADIEKAAKLALSARPTLSDEFPAAVLLYNPVLPRHEVMYWQQVNKLGKFQPYPSGGWFDVPENGSLLHPNCNTDHTRIFHSPVDAINAAFEQTNKFIGAVRREIKTEEENVQRQIDEKKALIDQINKAQEI